MNSQPAPSISDDEKELIFTKYQQLQQFVGWTDGDRENVLAIADSVRPYLPGLIDDFYQEIDRHEETRSVITEGAAQVERLKRTLNMWLADLFVGDYDQEFVARRWAIGHRHVEIGLDQKFTNAALSRLRTGLIRAIGGTWQSTGEQLCEVIISVNRLLDLDLAVIEDAYQSEYVRRQEQTQRLAALGQIAGGIAHELRNPLNVVKTSVFYLNNARNPTSEKMTEHLNRIERQVDSCDQVITAIADFARLPGVQLNTCDLSEVIQDVIKTHVRREDVQIQLEIAQPLVLRVDEQQIGIVFGNLVRNAIDAMPTGGTLTVSAFDDLDSICVVFNDTGVGMSPDLVSRIVQPLFSTKSKGIGLGLAISQSILDNHEAKLEISSEPGVGSRFLIRFPTKSSE